MCKLFGDGVCSSTDGGNCELTPPAQMWADARNVEMADGHCMGFAIASELLYKNQVPAGKRATFGDGPAPAFAVTNEVLQREIAYGFLFQNLDSVNASTVGGSPNDVLTQLTAALRTPSAETYTIGIYKYDPVKREKSGGHAVTAYGARTPGTVTTTCSSTTTTTRVRRAGLPF